MNEERSNSIVLTSPSGRKAAAVARKKGVPRETVPRETPYTAVLSRSTKAARGGGTADTFDDDDGRSARDAAGRGAAARSAASSRAQRRFSYLDRMYCSFSAGLAFSSGLAGAPGPASRWAERRFPTLRITSTSSSSLGLLILACRGLERRLRCAFITFDSYHRDSGFCLGLGAGRVRRTCANVTVAFSICRMWDADSQPRHAALQLPLDGRSKCLLATLSVHNFAEYALACFVHLPQGPGPGNGPDRERPRSGKFLHSIRNSLARSVHAAIQS